MNAQPSVRVLFTTLAVCLLATVGLRATPSRSFTMPEAHLRVSSQDV